MTPEAIACLSVLAVPVGILIAIGIYGSVKRFIRIRKIRNLIRQIIEKVENLTTFDIDIETVEKKIDRPIRKHDKLITRFDDEGNEPSSVLQINMADDNESWHHLDGTKSEYHANLNHYLSTRHYGEYDWRTHIFNINDDTGEIAKRISADRNNAVVSLNVKYLMAHLKDKELVWMINELERKNCFRTIFPDFDYICHEKDTVPSNSKLLKYIKDNLLDYLNHDLEYVYTY